MTLDEWIAKLGRAAQATKPAVEEVVAQASEQVVKDWRDLATQANPKHAAKYPASINGSRSVRSTANTVSATVQPGGGKVRKLGAVLEWGTPRSAPQRSNIAAAAAIDDVLTGAVARAAVGCLD